MRLRQVLLLGIICTVFLPGAPSSGSEGLPNARLLGTFQLSYEEGRPVVSGTLYALDRDSAVDWFRVETGSEPLLASTSPLEMIIRIETDGDAPHRICHRRTGGADHKRLTCADGSQLRTHWDPSTGPVRSIQVFLPTQGGVLHPPESIAVILLSGSAAPLFEIHIPYADTITAIAGADL